MTSQTFLLVGAVADDHFSGVDNPQLTDMNSGNKICNDPPDLQQKDSDDKSILLDHGIDDVTSSINLKQDRLVAPILSHHGNDDFHPFAGDSHKWL